MEIISNNNFKNCMYVLDGILLRLKYPGSSSIQSNSSGEVIPFIIYNLC